MKIAIIALTVGGKHLAEKVHVVFDDSFIDSRMLKVSEKLTDLWNKDVEAIICIMATGIVVRGISTLCRDKTLDPCVLVLDEKGQFVISLLSGHLGGGNQLAKKLAAALDGQAVITTASDVTGHTSLDLWAEKNHLIIDDSRKLTEKAAKLINNGTLSLFTDCKVTALPEDFQQVLTPEQADIIISDASFPGSKALLMRPRAISVGLGCNRGTEIPAFQEAVTELFNDNNLNVQSIESFASIDIKADEEGLLGYALSLNIPIQFFTKEQLNSVEDVSFSDVVFAATGAKGVAEPAAILAAEIGHCSCKLIIRKQKWKDVTAAVAIKQIQIVA